jgi:arsenate reductase (glutaredoxin)
MRFLEKHEISFTAKEITTTPPSIAELEQMLAWHQGNLKKLFNTSGMLYKEMNLSKKLPDMSCTTVLTLLNQHGMLVKRPFLIGKEVCFTGFNEKEWLTCPCDA